MYDEMEGEFNKADFPSKAKLLLVGKESQEDKNKGNYEYFREIELPYGTCTIDLMWDVKGKPEADLELKPLPEQEKGFVAIMQEPVPMSMN